MAYTNSSLVNYTKLSPNHSGTRTHTIDRISPHCVVGQVTVERLGEIFANKSRGASCNYGIGKDGKVALIVEERNRSWCTSSNANDQRAITIEIASDTTHPYAMNTVVYNKFIDLCVDICKRNGKTKLLWFENKTTSLNYVPKSNEMVFTVHRWFANKSCPGDWLYSRLGSVAEEVTRRLGTVSENVVSTTPIKTTGTSTNKNFPATPFTVQVLVPDLNYRKTGSMSGKILGQTGKGSFIITEVKNGWGKLKSGAGWIYLENSSYCKIGTTVVDTTKLANKFTPYKVKVTADVLNVRKGAGTNYGTNGTVKKNEIYTIVGEYNGKGAKKWLKLKSGAGYISSDYVKKV